MIVSTDNLARLRVGFNAAFKRGIGQATPAWSRVATRVPATTKEQRYGWLGKIPNVREWLGPRVVQNITESDYSIREKAWELTIGVDRDDIETDNLGIYAPLFEEMGLSAVAHPDQLVFGLLVNGFATNCYDGQFFFDTDHPVLDVDGATVLSVANTDGGAGAPWFLLDVSRALKPVILQVRRDYGDIVAKDKVTDDNVFDLNEFRYGIDARLNVGYGFWQFAWGSKQVPDAARYATARAALLGMKGDHGRPIGVNPNLVVCGPSNEKAFRDILLAERNANGSTNTNQGTAELLVVPWLV
jgi:phage major head subunit gpT-like protein